MPISWVGRALSTTFNLVASLIRSGRSGLTDAWKLQLAMDNIQTAQHWQKDTKEPKLTVGQCACDSAH
jgi:hypothetical protein